MLVLVPPPGSPNPTSFSLCNSDTSDQKLFAKLTRDIRHLLKTELFGMQPDSEDPPDLVDEDRLRSIAYSDCETLLVVVDHPRSDWWKSSDFEEAKVAGCGLLVVFDALTGRRARVEDFAVSSQFQRRGIGKFIMEKLFERANAADCVDVQLTSNPARVAARSLYTKCGMLQKDTDVYYYRLD